MAAIRSRRTGTALTVAEVEKLHAARRERLQCCGARQGRLRSDGEPHRSLRVLRVRLRRPRTRSKRLRCPRTAGMTELRADAVSIALRKIDAVSDYTLPQWEALIRQARPANVLSRIAVAASDAGLMDRIPPAPRAHLHAAMTVAHAQREAVHQEVAHIRHALAPLATEVVLLKGAAYLMADLPAARGRL